MDQIHSLSKIAQRWRRYSAPPSTMIVLSWNCRELGNLRAGSVLSHLVREKVPDVLFLMETKRTVEELRNIQVELHYDSMLAIPCVQRAGGLAMLWKAHVNLHIQTYSLNYIDTWIMTDIASPWRLTGFYGRPEEHRNHESWEYLMHLHSRDTLPWLCMGDFNEILSSNEKQGRHPHSLRCMEDFRSALLHCGLINLGFIGNIFTWRNDRPGNEFVQERLDRACATIKWQITIQVDSRVYRHKRQPSRFEEKWALHPDCENIIREAWNDVAPTGSLMYQLFEKIKRCCVALVGWSKTLGNSRMKIEEKYQALEVLISMNRAENLEEIQKVRDENNSLLFQDEFFWRQRSRSIWLPAGDKNTKHFHQRASQRQRKKSYQWLCG